MTKAAVGLDGLGGGELNIKLLRLETERFKWKHGLNVGHLIGIEPSWSFGVDIPLPVSFIWFKTSMADRRRW